MLSRAALLRPEVVDRVVMDVITNIIRSWTKSAAGLVRTVHCSVNVVVRLAISRTSRATRRGVAVGFLCLAQIKGLHSRNEIRGRRDSMGNAVMSRVRCGRTDTILWSQVGHRGVHRPRIIAVATGCESTLWLRRRRVGGRLVAITGCKNNCICLARQWLSGEHWLRGETGMATPERLVCERLLRS